MLCMVGRTRTKEVTKVFKVIQIVNGATKNNAITIVGEL